MKKFLIDMMELLKQNKINYTIYGGNIMIYHDEYDFEIIEVLPEDNEKTINSLQMTIKPETDKYTLWLIIMGNERFESVVGEPEEIMDKINETIERGLTW